MSPQQRTTAEPAAGVFVASAPWLSARGDRVASNRRAARAARAIAPAAVAGAFVALYVACATIFSQPAVAPGTEGYGYAGSTLLHGLTRWDGAWYARIAQSGYHALPGRYEPFAFFPLFPVLVATLHAALPLLSIPAAGLALNAAAIAVGATLVDRSLAPWTLSHRLLALAVILSVPSAFFAVAFYSEGLFFLASALVIWSVSRPSRLVWAPVGVLLGSLDRPLGFLLLILVLAALWRDGRPPRRRLALGACAAGAALTVPAIYWWITGNPIAFATAQGGWTSLRTLGVGDAVHWLLAQLNPWTATNWVVCLGYWEVLVVAVPMLLYLRRRASSVAAYGAVALAVGFLLGGVGTQSRYIAALIPVWVGAMAVLRRTSPRAWLPVSLTAVGLGVACNVWLISRFASGLWAG